MEFTSFALTFSTIDSFVMISICRIPPPDLNHLGSFETHAVPQSDAMPWPRQTLFGLVGYQQSSMSIPVLPERIYS